jgi:hypothetical protein
MYNFNLNESHLGYTASTLFAIDVGIFSNSRKRFKYREIHCEILNDTEQEIQRPSTLAGELLRRPLQDGGSYPLALAVDK